jgi:hypothetical protein
MILMYRNKSLCYRLKRMFKRRLKELDLVVQEDYCCCLNNFCSQLIYTIYYYDLSIVLTLGK